MRDMYYISGQVVGGTDGLFTAGKTPEEAFDNLADALMTMEEVKVSWWNKLLNRLKRYQYEKQRL